MKKLRQIILLGVRLNGLLLRIITNKRLYKNSNNEIKGFGLSWK